MNNPADEHVRTLSMAYARALSSHDEPTITALLKEEIQVTETQTFKIDLNDPFMPALHAAISHYAPVSFLRFLADLGADINGRDFTQDTPLHTIATRRDQNGKWPSEETISFLLSRGAAIDAQEKFGNTPFGFAATSGNMAAVKLLLERGADINSQNDTGYTAAMATLFNAGNNSSPKQSFEMARFLITHPDSDLLLMMRDGETIHDIARKKSDMPQDLMNLLEDRIAQQKVDKVRAQEQAKSRKSHARNMERLAKMIKPPKRPKGPQK